MPTHPARRSSPLLSRRSPAITGQAPVKGVGPKQSPHGPDDFDSVHAAIQKLQELGRGFTIQVWPYSPESDSARPSATSPRHKSKYEMGTRSAVPHESAEDVSETNDSWKPTGRAVLHLKEVAQVLGLSRTTIFRLIRDGKMRVIRVGSRTLVPVDVVEAILSSGL